MQPNFNAATSLCTKKFIKPKWKPLKFKIKSYFIPKCCKVRQRRAIEAEKQPNFLNLSFKEGDFFNETFGHEFYLIYSKK